VSGVPVTTDLEALRVQDARARREALDAARSFIVQAPAGSGKTELLIQRYLVLLARVDAPEEIVAITFTKKATAEMRARVLEALARAEDSAPPEKPHQRVTWDLARAARERDRSARWGIAENPNRLRIQTIDSLCHWLTRELPLASGFGAQPETLEDADPLCAEAAGRTLAGLDSKEPWARHVATVLRHLDNHVERARKLIADMLKVRDQWLRSVARARGKEREVLQDALANATRDALASLTAQLPEEARSEIVALASYAAGNLTAGENASPVTACRGMTALPGAAPEDLNAWRGLAAMLLTGKGELRRRFTADEGFPPPSGAKGAERQRREDARAGIKALIATLAPHRTFVEQLHFTRSLPPPVYTDAQWEVVEALAALLPTAVAMLKVLFQERGLVDFTEVSQRAVQALGEPDAPTDLALALDYRIRHVLVDEFQDTSWSQYDLLAGLTAGWQPGDGRTLFVVGDPMQSIYRFRKAEVGLYMRAWHEGIGPVTLQRLVLAVNFRSTGAIVRWFNAAFEQVLPDEEDLASGAVPFSPSVADRDAPEGVVPQVHVLASTDRAAEARLVAGLVRQVLAENPGGEVALLVRSRAHLAEIAPALKDAEIPFQAIEIETLGHRPVVQDLLALTRALVHPADRVAWLSVLRAPWCGLTLADLEALAGHDRGAALWTLLNDAAVLARLSGDGKQRLTRVRDALGAALAARRREPFARWVEGAWLALGGPACARDATDLEDARVFFKLLEALEEGGDLPALETLAERVANLYALPEAGTEAARVQLMTIHKAKGLQFDSVILPGLGYPPRRDDPKLLLWLERPRILPPLVAGEKNISPLPSRERVRERGEADLLLAPIREAAAEADPIYEYLKALESAKEEHEAARLLYVAATRARSRLHLVGQVDWKAERALRRAQDRLAKPKSRSLLEHLWPAVSSEFERLAEQAAAAVVLQETEGPPHAIRRVASGWKPPEPPAATAWKLPAGPEYQGKSPHDEVEFSWASETVKHVGTVVHRFLQIVAEEGIARWDAQRVASLREVFARDLLQLGVPDAERKGAVTRVHDALAASLTAERGRWVLGAHAQARVELRLTGTLTGEIVSVALDRTFVDESGTRWIVDYKTGTHEGGDLEAFLDRERERYRPQLERYAQLLRGLDSRPIRLGLYFPLLNGWREWKYEG
jgi:ATP-dependent exoDNAse (exonuclease V) beta subunit